MIGTGFMGKAHSNAFRQVGHFFEIPYTLDLKVVCGRDELRRTALAQTWGWTETESDWRSMVDRKDIDVVDIGTPNALHAPIAMAAAQAGKIILCEKPLATSVEEAQQMADSVRGHPNLVWFNYRRVPAIALAKRMIEEERLGQIHHYRAVYLNPSGNEPGKASGWRYRREEAGSGASGDLLSHLLDLALYLNGPIRELTAMMHTFAPDREVDDATALLARFANGSIGTFEATRYGVGYRNRNAFEIHGSRGMLAFDLEDMNTLVYSDATEAANLQGPSRIMVTGPDQPYSDNFWPRGHTIGYEHTFITTIADFLSAMATGKDFHPDFEDGLSVQRLLHTVEQSSAQGRWMKVQ